MDAELVQVIKLFRGVLRGSTMIKSKIKISKQDGFTLLEMLVVILIIGILGGIAVLGLKSANRTARVQSCKVEVSSVYSAALAYKSDNTDSITEVYDPTLKTTLNPLYPNYLQPLTSNLRYKIQYKWQSVDISYIQIFDYSIIYSITGVIPDATSWGVGSLITVSGNANNDFNVKNMPISLFTLGTPTTFKVATNLPNALVNASPFTGTKATINVPTIVLTDLLTNSILAPLTSAAPESACNSLS
jgi:prepilin-type N-terminal cleavage/methylation domain-containing protein